MSYKFSAGQRVVLVITDDAYTKLKPGDEGTVSLVDDFGTVHVDWDAGSGLGMVEQAGDVIVPLDVDLTNEEATQLIHALVDAKVYLPRPYELAVKGYAGDDDFVGTPPEEYFDVLESYDTFMFWRS